MGTTGEYGGTETGAEGTAPAPSFIERGLFNAALLFFEAAATAIDSRAPDEADASWDGEALSRVRKAMQSMERWVGVACRAGLSPHEIAAITRFEDEMIEQIVSRHGSSAPNGSSQRTGGDDPRTATAPSLRLVTGP